MAFDFLMRDGESVQEHMWEVGTIAAMFDHLRRLGVEGILGYGDTMVYVKCFQCSRLRRI